MSFYIGIDLTDIYAVVSYYQLNNEESQTVSLIAGSEIYQIPVILAKKRNLGQWYFGDEASRMAKTGDMICVEKLYSRALNREIVLIGDERFEATELLALYLKRIISLTQTLGNPNYFDKLVITVPEVNRKVFELFADLAGILGISKKKLTVMDHKECFYYYALNQKPDLWLHDVVLFEAENDVIQYFLLNRNLHTVPQLITIEASPRFPLNYDKDAAFHQVLEKAFSNRIVSSCFLTGDGFDGNWMHASLNYLCRGRRAFLGKNLYSKGAAYAAAIHDNAIDWQFVFLGENEMKFNLSLKVVSKGVAQFYDLVSAGTNWFEASASCDLLLGEDNEITFYKQLPNSKEAKIESLELSDLPERPARTSRLHVEARPLSDEKIELEIKDLGFGDFFPSSGKVWKYTMHI